MMFFVPVAIICIGFVLTMIFITEGLQAFLTNVVWLIFECSFVAGIMLLIKYLIF